MSDIVVTKTATVQFSQDLSGYTLQILVEPPWYIRVLNYFRVRWFKRQPIRCTKDYVITEVVDQSTLEVGRPLSKAGSNSRFTVA